MISISGWLDKGNRFDRFFIFMMIWPISPADFLCMLAALTKMSFKRYMTIIILTKPFTLVVYTYGLTYIIDFFLANALTRKKSVWFPKRILCFILKLLLQVQSFQE